MRQVDDADGDRALGRTRRRHLFPATLRRLYIARGDDQVGDDATASLIDRANEAGI